MTAQSTTPDGKLRTLAPATLRARLRLAPEHASLIEAETGTRKLLGRLIDAGLLAEAARLIAYALPPREAVWWACICVAHTAADMPDAEQRALAAAETWVRRPDDETKRAAALAAAAAGYACAGAWPALAAYWTRASVPADTRTGRGVETAVIRASQRDHPERAARRFHRFFASAHDIAGGGAGKLPAETPMTAEETP